MSEHLAREKRGALRRPEAFSPERFFEYGYLVLLGIVTLMAFIDTTMLTVEQMGWMYGLIPRVRLALLVFVGAKLAWDRDWQRTEILAAALLCGALIGSWQRVERGYVLETALLIAGAHGIDFKKIARVWFVICAAGLIVTVVLALTGVIENLAYVREGHRRLSFGIIYPTDFSAHVFFLAAAWAWIRERRITFWEIGGIVLLAAFCLVFCDARNSVGCLVLLAAGLLYLKLRRRGGERRGRPYGMTRPLQWILALCAPVLAAVMILLSRFYDPASGWLSGLDGLLSGRLSLGQKGFALYPVRLFGQNVHMNGLGGGEPSGSYFFLDSSYVNLLLCFGLVTLVCLLGAFLLAALREKRLGAWERLGILAVVALQCMVEHHMIEIAYDVFLLLPFAASGGMLLTEKQDDKTPV